jgi:hypothetical protein
MKIEGKSLISENNEGFLKAAERIFRVRFEKARLDAPVGD